MARRPSSSRMIARAARRETEQAERPPIKLRSMGFLGFDFEELGAKIITRDACYRNKGKEMIKPSKGNESEKN